ncbi:MAG: hypothetical protein V1899_00860 [Planctomycetota bacterium]
MSKDKNVVRAIALGLVMAALGFCYATATSSRESVAPTIIAGSRAVGSSTIHFTNALLAAGVPPALDTFDLGDAFYGSVITRYVTATGGARPYRFAPVGLVPQMAANSTFVLYASGGMMGSIAVGTVSPLSFTSYVSDSTGTLPQMGAGIFNINLFTSSHTIFRFAVDKINNGVLGLAYISKLETLGGNIPVVFSVMPNTLAMNGVPRGSAGGLEVIGLSLAQDGTIFGRPLEVGRVTFMARAIDGLKRIATKRNPADMTMDQEISFNIEDTGTTNTNYTTLTCSVKGDTSKVGKDSIKFSGLINLSGIQINWLVGYPFVFRLGGASFAGQFNLKGQVVNNRGGPIVFPDGSRLKCHVNARNGQIKGTVTKANLSKQLGVANFVDRTPTRLGVNLSVFNSHPITFATNIMVGIVGADMLEFATRRAGNKFGLNFNLGKIGKPLGGIFQIVSVKGIDKKTITGEEGDIWAAKFLIGPRTGIDPTPGLDGISALGVRIGTSYVNRISGQSLISGKDGSATLNISTDAPVVTKLKINAAKFTGSFITNPLAGNPNARLTTGIPQAWRESYNVQDSILPKDNTLAFFNLGFDIDRGGTNSRFSGEGGRGIYLSNLARLPSPASGPNVHITPKMYKVKNVWVDQSNKR